MRDIYIKTNTHNIFDYMFQNKDIVSIKELLDTIEDQYFEIKSLQEKIDDLELTKEYDEHSAWQDQALEEGIL